ncbi:TetR family transcriptional regulator [Sphaerisporangium rufum]|uniref:TetR family transcriptional regulator n=1 Tax=Sphaerisporangium rufum TaxID=1381558 RepID=A0A919R2A7_9ACTN|nr:TetR/AcrR family transcriptional regulator [Sphaerisporangium rufum]GII78411.1 TetR family transcriptional regulator [Sphaerisporangium rufum]
MRAAPTGEGPAPPGPEISAREERAHRILDAAAELVERWGYDKTTVGDVARVAGVAKGTIYLHWKSRQALFGALLRRDRVRMLEEIRRGLGETPGGATPREMFHHLGLAMFRRPLVRAAVLNDTEVLGRLLRHKPTVQTTEAMRWLADSYLRVLREHHAVREDLSPAELVNTITGTIYGFFMFGPKVPEPYRLSDERLAGLLADTLHRALDSGHALSAAEAAAVSRATLAYVDHALKVARDRLRLSFDTTDLEKDYVR